VIRADFFLVIAFLLAGLILILNLLGTFTSVGTKLPYISAFSIFDNTGRLFNVKSTRESTGTAVPDFKFINGVRAFSISWVIYGHTALLVFATSRNFINFPNYLA
jgi:hypothetical protein